MPEDFQWCPSNPHPIFKLRTELVRDGKYDEYGWREVDAHDKPGKHSICIKVVDVFGCDTSITLEVSV